MRLLGLAVVLAVAVMVLASVQVHCLDMIVFRGNMSSVSTGTFMIDKSHVVLSNVHEVINGSLICAYPRASLVIDHSDVSIVGPIACGVHSGVAVPVLVVNVSGSATGSIGDLASPDDHTYTVSAANMSGIFTAIVMAILHVPELTNVSVPGLTNITLTVCGNSSITPNLNASIIVLSPDGYVKIGTLNTTVERCFTYTSALRGVLVNGSLVLMINLTDSRNIPFTLSLDYLSANVSYIPGINMTIVDSHVYASGGVIMSGNVRIVRSVLVMRHPLHLYNTNVILVHSHVVGLLVGNNVSITNVFSHVELSCSRCISRTPISMVETLEKTVRLIRHVAHRFRNMVRLVLSVENLSIPVRLRIHVDWCNDNHTVIVLPNGSIVQFHACSINLTLIPRTKLINISIIHGVYIPKAHILISVGSLTNMSIPQILNATSRPRAGLLCNVTVNATHGTRSIVTIYNASMPRRVFVNGSDVTAFEVSNISKCNLNACWLYNETSRELIFNVYHASPVIVTAYNISFSINITVRNGVLYVRVGNPYNYTENLTIRITLYRFMDGREVKTFNITLPPDSYNTVSTSVGNAVKVSVEVFDEHGVEIYSRTIMLIGLSEMLLIVALPVIFAIVIAAFILVKKYGCLRERRKMFKIS